MNPAIEFIVLLGCTIAGAVLAIYWGAVGFHAIRTLVVVPTARSGLTLAKNRKSAAWPRVCVIVPAHNEEACIGTVAASLVAQDYPNLRVVFSLDRCTDKTAAALRSVTGPHEHVEIIEVTTCPDDWAGKVNAIWRAVKDSHGARDAELLLFVDADTRLDPACVRACVALMEARSLGFVSLLSTMNTSSWFERVVQPVAGIELMRQYPIVRASAPTHRRPFANGQFILMKRDVYELIGGHEAVHDALLEDIELARHAYWRGIAAGMFLARGMIHCRMYSTWQEFRRGWKRIYTESANRKPGRMRTQGSRVRLLGTYLPAACLAGVLCSAWWMETAPLAPITMWVSASALVLWLLIVGLCYKMGNTPAILAFAYPIGAWKVGSILREAAGDLDRGVKTTWGGREYVLGKR